MKVKMTDDAWRVQESGQLYLIRVQGRISQKWSRWLEDMSISVDELEGEPTVTELTGELADQAALQGLLQKLFNLGFSLLELRRWDGRDFCDDREHG